MATRKKKSVPRKRVREKQPTGALELLTLLIEAVAAEYHKDPTRAGVVVSRLANGMHYISIVRYSDPYGGGKKMVLRKEGPDFAETLRELAGDWHTMVTPPPVVDLVKKLGAALA